MVKTSKECFGVSQDWGLVWTQVHGTEATRGDMEEMTAQGLQQNWRMTDIKEREGGREREGAIKSGG